MNPSTPQDKTNVFNLITHFFQKFLNLIKQNFATPGI